MPRLFQAYIMIDWSAASKPATGENSIWFGVMKRNVRFQLQYESHNPPTRKEAETLLLRLLEDFAKRGDRVLVGFDFCLGFPHGTASALKLAAAPAWQATHALLSRDVKDKADNTNNRFQVAAMLNRMMSGGPFPFWGCPPKDALTTLSPKKTRQHGADDVPEFRHADAAAKGTAPVWKLYTSGSVGSQTLLGIPMVTRVRKARPNTRLWPFETGWTALTPDRLDGVEAVFVEGFPTAYPVQVQPGEVKDAAQVRAVTEVWAAADERDSFGQWFAPPDGLDGHREAVETEEGWILLPR